MREPLFRKEQRLFHFPMLRQVARMIKIPRPRRDRHGTWYLRVALNLFKLRSAPGDLNKFRINLKQGIIDACTR
ncbi:hypothetical protein [Burkholderia cepacia]|uniref:hypothetical protein n=2 Tax=Burkholderia cepacia TaxID=292 RepID=UPI000B32A74B|nr:hypothetical protein [Burkholderia cepacia]